MARNLKKLLVGFFMQKIVITVFDKLHLFRVPPAIRKSHYLLVREGKRRLRYVLTEARNLLLMALGIFSAAVGLKSFLIPNGFIDGGITGISLLTARLTDVHVAFWLLLYNIPFMVLGYSQINRSFSIKSIIAVIGLSIVVATVQLPQITTDKLLVAVFGGFFLGLGIGLAVRGGSVLDGTEVLAIYLGRRTGMTVGDVLLIANIIIFSTAAVLLGIEIALYSILIYLAASRTVDFVLEGIEEYTGVTIISNHSEAIRNMIQHKLGRGVTVFQGKGGYGKRGFQKQDEILYTVITRLEVAKLYAEIDLIDPDAFIVMSSIKDTRGGMVKKHPHKIHTSAR